MPRFIFSFFFIFFIVSCAPVKPCSGLNPEIGKCNTPSKLRKGKKSCHSRPEKEAMSRRQKASKGKKGFSAKGKKSGSLGGGFHFHLGGSVHLGGSGHANVSAKN